MRKRGCRAALRSSSGGAFAIVVAVAAFATVSAGGAAGLGLPAGFQDSVVVSGLTAPTAVALSPDGRIFVAEKSGLIKVVDGPGGTPTVFADLRTNVHNFWDRGMSGLVLHPDFPHTPYLYVSYTLDAPIGGTPPLWGTAGATSDNCPTPPGPTSNGCVVGGRLSRLQASGDTMVGAEQVLIEAWCQQFPSHSVDAVVFGNDGALYVSAGDGANFNTVDYGQFGSPLNPCGDPPVGIGGTQTPPTAEGGALRAQSVRRGPGAPAVLNGAVLRLDALTGQALPDNPLVGSGIAGADRIIAYGLRNPFRMAARPGTNEIWVGDVGWSDWDEIDRIAATADGVVENFGWPCYEGLGPQPSYQAAHLDRCSSLYQQVGNVTAPVYAYTHGQTIVTGETCGTGGNTISGLAFYPGGSYPAAYNGALFFSDYSRDCIWAMLPGPDGAPDPTQRANFAVGADSPVDLKIGPGGDLYYVELSTGSVHRVQYFGNSQPPIALAHSDVGNGPLPLTVHFDASASYDPDPGDSITYAWDLDGDGQFNDSTAVTPQFTYTQAATVDVRLRVTDSHGLFSIATLAITAGNTAPSVSITAPLPTQQWQVGSMISFSGTATDPEEGTLPPAKLSWSIIMHHCPQNTCHLHPVQSYSGIASGAFYAPDHEYPSFLEIRLTATDSGGLASGTSVFVYPRTVTLSFQSVPSGLALAIGSASLATPFQQVVIVGSANTISAPSPQILGGSAYLFSSWSDGGAASHTIVAPATATTLLATFAPSSGPYCGDGNVDPGEQCDDGGTVDGDCCSATCQIESGPGCAPTPTPTGTPAPFRLYMQSVTADIAGYSVLATSPGTAGATGAINTVNGPTAGMQFAGKWMSCPLAAPVTVTGPVTADGWGRESNGAANVGLELRLYKYSGGVEGPAFFAVQSPGAACTADGSGCTELAVLDETFNEYSWTAAPTSTSFAAGDRVVAKWFGNDAGGGAMASGYNAGVRYGTASGKGLSWLGLSETLVCQTTPTNTPTATLTQTPTPIATMTLTATASRTPTASATPSATPTRTASATASASATPTASPSATVAASPTPTPTATASGTPAPFRLYMQSVAGDVAGYSVLATSPGIAAATGAINTVNGPTVGVQFGGKWMSCPLAAPATVTGPVTAEGWGRREQRRGERRARVAPVQVQRRCRGAGLLRGAESGRRVQRRRHRVCGAGGTESDVQRIQLDGRADVDVVCRRRSGGGEVVRQ